jgi:hypothetical protein
MESGSAARKEFKKRETNIEEKPAINNITQIAATGW